MSNSRWFFCIIINEQDTNLHQLMTIRSELKDLYLFLFLRHQEMRIQKNADIPVHLNLGQWCPKQPSSKKQSNDTAPWEVVFFILLLMYLLGMSISTSTYHWWELSNLFLTPLGSGNFASFYVVWMTYVCPILFKMYDQHRFYGNITTVLKN